MCGFGRCLLFPMIKKNVINRMKALIRPQSTGWTLASKPSQDYMAPMTKICVRVETRRLPWETAKRKCYNDNAFLIRTDVRVDVAGRELPQYVSDNGLCTYLQYCVV